MSRRVDEVRVACVRRANRPAVCVSECDTPECANGVMPRPDPTVTRSVNLVRAHETCGARAIDEVTKSCLS